MKPCYEVEYTWRERINRGPKELMTSRMSVHAADAGLAEQEVFFARAEGKEDFEITHVQLKD